MQWMWGKLWKFCWRKSTKAAFWPTGVSLWTVLCKYLLPDSKHLGVCKWKICAYARNPAALCLGINLFDLRCDARCIASALEKSRLSFSLISAFSLLLAWRNRFLRVKKTAFVILCQFATLRTARGNGVKTFPIGGLSLVSMYQITVH